MRISYLKSLVMLFLAGQAFLPAMAQPSTSVIDTLLLGNLCWGMTRDEAKMYLADHIKIKVSSDTTLTYEDDVFAGQAMVTLAFGRGHESLTTVNVDFKKPNEESMKIVSEHLHRRYGPPQDRRKKEEKKILGTFTLDLLLWRADSLQVTLGRATFGGKVAGLFANFAVHR